MLFFVIIRYSLLCDVVQAVARGQERIGFVEVIACQIGMHHLPLLDCRPSSQPPAPEPSIASGVYRSANQKRSVEACNFSVLAVI
jgi:hypothetical protein